MWFRYFHLFLFLFGLFSGCVFLEARWDGGIGARMVYNRESSLLRVIEVPLDSPSHRAGLRSGDIIVSIDGLPTSRMKLSEILEALRGPVGSKVRLFILRGKKYHRIIVERAPYSRR